MWRKPLGEWSRNKPTGPTTDQYTSLIGLMVTVAFVCWALVKALR